MSSPEFLSYPQEDKIVINCPDIRVARQKFPQRLSRRDESKSECIMMAGFVPLGRTIETSRCLIPLPRTRDSRRESCIHVRSFFRTFRSSSSENSEFDWITSLSIEGGDRCATRLLKWSPFFPLSVLRTVCVVFFSDHCLASQLSSLLG